MKKTTDEREWAHSCPWWKLPITLSGPIISHEEICQWARMGPFLSMKKTANEHEWAYSGQWIKLPMSVSGPIAVHEETADKLEWAHCLPWRTLLMSMNGPILANEENSLTRMGSFRAISSMAHGQNGPMHVYWQFHSLTRMGPFRVVGSYLPWQSWAHSCSSAVFYMGEDGPTQSHQQFLHVHKNRSTQAHQ